VAITGYVFRYVTDIFKLVIWHNADITVDIEADINAPDRGIGKMFGVNVTRYTLSD
jgi:hypothetical protein